MRAATTGISESSWKKQVPGGSFSNRASMPTAPSIFLLSQSLVNRRSTLSVLSPELIFRTGICTFVISPSLVICPAATTRSVLILDRVVNRG